LKIQERNSLRRTENPGKCKKYLNPMERVKGIEPSYSAWKAQFLFWHQLAVMRALCSTVGASFSKSRELSMKKIILIGLAILAVSTSGALAKKATKPKAPAAAATTGGAAPLMMGQVSAADLALYKKNQRDSGMKK